VIRRADREDALVLTELERLSSSTALGHVFGPDLPFPFDDVLARWTLVLANPDTTTLVDEDDEGPCGYAAYGDGWLHHFGLLPRLWGTGRADVLHAAVLDGLSAQGVHTSYLWVLVENHRARAFYARRGWQDTGVREREVFRPFPEKMQLQRALDPHHARP
jgi:GNAT superfamily N-acetyltransferase